MEPSIEESKNRRLYFRRKKVLAVVLLILIFLYSGINLYVNRATFWQALKDEYEALVIGEATPNEAIAELETMMTDEAYERMDFVELFSLANVLMDKREINDFSYIKDETGSLHYASFYRERDTEMFEYAMRVMRLKEYVSQYGTDVLFVIAPSKYVKSESVLRTGMPINDPETKVDELLFYLNRLDVDTLDLNQYIPCDEVPYEEAFFKTDHHWTAKAAFYATQVLCNTLNDSYGYGLDIENYLTEDVYSTVTYRQGMLGSMGRGTGVFFSGIDDFTAYYPDFEMNFYRNTLQENGEYSSLEGDIIGTLILPDTLTSDSIYSDSQYSLYMNGLRQFEQIENKDNPDGLSVFMIRDSYFSPVISFMAPLCGSIDAMWSMEEFDELDIERYVKENRFDCIIIEYYPYNIEESAFEYFKETD
ncbi:MAG: hypothetical protein K6E13_08140 [Lachnospiraceae bacterium]|nr:hypothetical protein [Lachnospiraceae bacterium]